MSVMDEKQMELVAKARNAQPPSIDILPVPSGKSQKQSWQDAFREVDLKPREVPYPKLHDFEKSILPSINTTRTQFLCDMCPYCNHPIISSIFHSIHLEECSRRTAQLTKEEEPTENSTQGTKNSASDVSIKPEVLSGSTSAGSASAGAGNSIPIPAPIKRKRKQNKDDDDGVSKKSKGSNPKTKEPKKPGAKTRQPKKEKAPKEKPSVTYNPDKNCGVPLPNGLPCMRSLTCKQHPMGAKRSVIGRSAPYDVLLSNYHRQHQMKQAQLTASAAQAAQIESDQQQELEAQQNPEREISQVFGGVSLAVYAPLAVNESLTSTSLRTQRFRMREMLSMALLPKRLPPTGNLIFGRSYAFKEGSPDELYNMRSQAVQQAVYIRHRWQQKQKQQQMLEQMKRVEANKQTSN